MGGLTFTARLLSWDVSFWSILWPSAFLVYGLKGLFPRFSVFSFGVTLIGAYYLIENLGVWSLDIAGKLVFPIIVVLFGLGLLFDALRKPKKPHFSFIRKGTNTSKTESKLTEDSEHFDSNLSFGENTHVVTLSRMSSGSASVSFGELIVDLTQCGKIADGCKLDLNCSFGELHLRLPKHCRGVVNPGTAFGSVEYEGRPDPDADTVVHIDGNVSFGNMIIEYC